MYIVVVVNIIIVIVYWPPLWCRSCLRSISRKISPYPSWRLIRFQHKLDFQLRRSSYFIERRQEVMFVFFKYSFIFKATALIFKLNQPSSSSNMGVTVFEKIDIPCCCPHFGNFKLYLLSVCVSVCLSVSPLNFKTSHWPSDHMISLRPLIG